jgi:predicted nucleotidyltransferase
MNTGIRHLWLFGSHAKWTARNDSDVDLLYQYDSKYVAKGTWPLFSSYSIVGDLLQRKVDLVANDYIDHRIKDGILSSYISIY